MYRPVVICKCSALALIACGWVVTAAAASNLLDLYVDIPTAASATATRQAIDQLVTNAQQNGIGRLIPSMSRADGSVMWQTPLETYDTQRTSQLAEGFDALAYTIQRAHASGIQVYPSVITNMGGSIVTQNPLWASRDKNGVAGGDPQFTTPSLSFAYTGARQAKVNQLMTLVNNYPVDGVFLDYARYFEGFGYDQPTLDYVQQTYGFDARTAPVPGGPFPETAASSQYNNWKKFAATRADTVRDFVQEFRQAIDTSNTGIRLGTFADHRRKLYLDTMHLGRGFTDWAQAGLVDDVFLGNYDEPIYGVPNDLFNVGIRQSLSWTRDGVPPVPGVAYIPGVGPTVPITASLSRSIGVRLSTETQYYQAVAETLIGGGNRFFVYHGNDLTSTDYALLQKINRKVEKLTAFASVSRAAVSYNAASAQDLPSTTGWTGGGNSMSFAGGSNSRLQQVNVSGQSFYLSPAQTGVMSGILSDYAVEFRVQPLTDLTASSANARALHVAWSNGADTYSLLIDKDANDGTGGSTGSLRYGLDAASQAVTGLNFATPQTIQIQYHTDNATFYFFVGGKLVSYMNAADARAGNAGVFADLPSLTDRLLFGDSSTSGASASADWYTAGIYEIDPGSAWRNNANGAWSSAGNWRRYVPSGTGAIARFTDAITLPRSISLDSPRTVGGILFDNTARYTIAGSATLTLDNGTTTASIDVARGSHTIATPVHLVSDAMIAVPASSSVLTLSGEMTSTGTQQLTKTGSGTLEVRRMEVAGLRIEEGTVKLTNGVSRVQELSIDQPGTASLRLGANPLIVDYAGSSPILEIRDLITSGRIAASSVIGFGEAIALGTTSFEGQAVDASTVLLRPTIAGDANLDGTVTSADFVRFVAGYGNPAGVCWTEGDFDADGRVDTQDFNLLAGNFGLSAAPILGATVPEPAGLTGLILLALNFYCKGRRARGGMLE